MGLQIAREVVTACDYNQQLSMSGQFAAVIVTPTLLHSKVTDRPAGFRCLCCHKCFKVRGQQNSLLYFGAAEQFAVFWCWFWTLVVSGAAVQLRAMAQKPEHSGET